MLLMLYKGSTDDDWMEDLLLTIGSRIYRRLRVGLCSYIDLFNCLYVGVSFCDLLLSNDHCHTSVVHYL